MKYKGDSANLNVFCCIRLVHQQSSHMIGVYMLFSSAGTPLQKEYLTKKEDSKPTIIEISDTKPRLDSRDPTRGVSYLKPDSCEVHIDSSSPLKSPKRKLMPPLETASGVWPREVSAEMHRLGAFAMHTSIIDLSQEKELDLSKKPKVSEAQDSCGKKSHGFETQESSGKKRKIPETQESSGESATSLKRKILKNRKTATEEFANTVVMIIFCQFLIVVYLNGFLGIVMYFEIVYYYYKHF